MPSLPHIRSRLPAADVHDNEISDISSELIMIIVVAVLLYIVGVSLRFFFPIVGDYENGHGFMWMLPGEEAMLRRVPAGSAYGAMQSANAAPTYENLLALEDAIGDVESGLAPEQINVLPT
eukprot:IDg21154t1